MNQLICVLEGPLLPNILQKGGRPSRFRNSMRLSTFLFSCLLSHTEPTLFLLPCLTKSSTICWLFRDARGGAKECSASDYVIQPCTVRPKGWEKTTLIMSEKGEFFDDFQCLFQQLVMALEP